MRNKPQVSVIIPVYNGANFIKQTVESALAQTLVPLEILVVDDGSTDATVSIVRELANFYPIIKLLYQSQGGVSKARNTAIAAAKGEIFALVDADDVWLPTYLERMTEYADQYSIVFSDYQTIDSTSALLSLHKRVRANQVKLPDVLTGNFISPSTMIFGRKLWESVGPYDEELEVAEDWDWLIRALLLGAEIKHSSAALCQYRLHNTSMTKNVGRMVRCSLQVLDKTFAGNNLPLYLHSHKKRAYYINYIIAAGKFLAVSDVTRSNYYLEQALQTAPAYFLSLQTFISFLKIYAQTGDYDLSQQAEYVTNFIYQKSRNNYERTRLIALGELSLFLFNTRHYPLKALRHALKAFKTYPALLFYGGVYRTIWSYTKIYLWDALNRLQVRFRP